MPPSLAVPLPRMIGRRAPDGAIALVLAALVVILISVTCPLANIPHNDDFSYARSARALAETGRIIYNGWASPMLLPQLAWGAIIIKVWGFSYNALDVAGIVAAGLSTALMYWLARACGCPRRLAVLATAILTLNPMFLVVAPSFMTEVPSLLLLLIALLVLVRALGPGPTGHVDIHPRSLALSAVLGIIAGTNRQVIWVAEAAALTTLLVCLPRQHRLIVPAVAAVLGWAAVLTGWFNHQPYTIPVDLERGLDRIAESPGAALTPLYQLLNMMGLFLLPLAVLGAWGRSWRSVRTWALVLLCLLPVLHWLVTGSPALGPEYRLPAHGQYFTSSGVAVGFLHGFEHRPRIIPVWLVDPLLILGAIGMALTGDLIIDWWIRVRRACRQGLTAAPISVSLVASASLGQIAAMVPWSAMVVFDRYLLLLFPGFLILLAAQAAARRVPVVLIGLATLAVAAMGVVSVGSAGEYKGYTRARARLFADLIHHGVPPCAIDGGFELNGETQLRVAGHINHPMIRKPPMAYRGGAAGKHVQFAAFLFPVLDARYLLSTEPRPDPSLVWPDPVGATTYSSLFPPHRRAMYVYRVKR